jgi:hypothetical protein
MIVDQITAFLGSASAAGVLYLTWRALQYLVKKAVEQRLALDLKTHEARLASDLKVHQSSLDQQLKEFQSSLDRELESHKASLAAQNALAVEELKFDHQLKGLEHQVRFSRLHDRQAKVIEEAYALIVELEFKAREQISIAVAAGIEYDEAQRYVDAFNQSVTVMQFFSKHRLLFPEPVCVLIEEFLAEIKFKCVKLGIYSPFHIAPERLTDDSKVKKAQVWLEVADYWDKVAPKAKSALEEELRKMLGIRQ